MKKYDEQLCKRCVDVMRDSFAGQAITFSDCFECGEKMYFPNTDVHLYCETCSKKLNVCRRCGTEMKS